MTASSYQPLYALTRGKTVESVHYGAIAVVDVYGRLLAWQGDPDTVTFLRSTAKPFQVLPFLTHNGDQYYDLTQREIAILCASHSGTDEHVAVVRAVQSKTGVQEDELLCGIHDPYDVAAALALKERNETATANRHNCSGKHTGMLAFTKMKKQHGDLLDSGLEYIDPAHPIQREILSTFAEMCDLAIDQVACGMDGCSAPNFAAPLRNVALAFARLCDPQTGAVMPAERAAACRKVTAAMSAHPDMVAGPGHFDTRLMELARGRIIAKGGAEGYQGVGLLPGAIAPGSPAMGIALKIADGDSRRTIRAAVTLEVLRLLGALSQADLAALADLGPRLPVLNVRGLLVGEGFPTIELQRSVDGIVSACKLHH